jgi:hypothetical protein
MCDAPPPGGAASHMNGGMGAPPQTGAASHVGGGMPHAAPAPAARPAAAPSGGGGRKRH